jgi:hypothetical protein
MPQQNPTIQTVQLQVGFDNQSNSPTKPTQASNASKPNVKLASTSTQKIKALISPKTSTQKLFQLVKTQSKPLKQLN